MATAYRVTLWEQPAGPPDIDRPRMGWSPYLGAAECPGSNPVGGRDARV